MERERLVKKWMEPPRSEVKLTVLYACTRGPKKRGEVTYKIKKKKKRKNRINKWKFDDKIENIIAITQKSNRHTSLNTRTKLFPNYIRLNHKVKMVGPLERRLKKHFIAPYLQG